MKKFKDIFYNKNDILVAVLILAVAALLITWRVNVIMDYPETLVAQAKENAQQSEQSENPSTSDGGVTEGGIDGGDGTEDPNTGFFSLYIAYGDSLESIGANLVTLGYFETSQEFVTMVNSQNAATKIKAENHVLPRNATKEEVIQYLTD